jgi:nudix-type nucleoside diphosphatase (YffH/AdpP family)
VTPDGSVRRYEREVVNHGDASAVLLLDSARRVAVLVRQWRAPLVGEGRDPYLLEACAGVLADGETPEEAAHREVLEETGYTLRSLRPLGSILPSGGTLTERIHLFVGEIGRRRHAGGGDPAEGEHVEVVELPLAALFAMARRNDIEDAKTLILVQRLMIEGAQGS